MISCDTDEEKAVQVLQERLHRAPGLSVNMLREKIFGRFDSDLEFQLIMYAAAPLYSEIFDADAALKRNLETEFFAKSHSRLFTNWSQPCSDSG